MNAKKSKGCAHGCAWFAGIIGGGIALDGDKRFDGRGQAVNVVFIQCGFDRVSRAWVFNK